MVFLLLPETLFNINLLYLLINCDLGNDSLINLQNLWLK
jgi:hypothetical protein